jgi:hypothetical protein
MLLALVLALLFAHRSFPLRDPVPGPDRAAPALRPPPSTGTAHLPYVIDENVRVRSMPSAPPAGAMMGRMMDLRAAFKDMPEYRPAYQQGRAEAEAQLKENRAGLYASGPRMTTESTDRQTGLPLEWIGGCAIDPSLLGRTDGHNDRIREAIAAHGPPANSFKRWDKELFDLKGYCARRRESVAPHRLCADGPALKSPDGRFTVRPVKTRVEGPNGRGADRLEIVVGEPGFERPAAVVDFDEGPAELVWGPQGSGFAVIHCRRHEHDRYMALDLRTGRWLRCESEDDDSVQRVGVGDPPAGPP